MLDDKLAVPKLALVDRAVGHLSDALTVELVILVHSLVYCAVGVGDLPEPIKLVILEYAFEYFTLDCYSARLTVQVVILEVALAELFLIYVVAKSVQLVETILVYHLTGKGKLLIFFVVYHEGSPDLSDLAKILPVLDADELPYTFDPEFVFELELPLLV